MVNKEWMTQFPFLKEMPEDERRYFLLSAVIHRLHADEVVVREHTNCIGVVFVISGELKVYKLSKNGRELALYPVLPGEIAVLTMNCLAGDSLTASEVSLAAVQDSTIAIVPCSAFCYLYSISPPLQRFVALAIFKKFSAVIELVEKLAFESVNDRLYDYICENTDGGRMPLYTTHAQLAARLGTSREVVTRCLHKMKRNGTLQSERGKIWLIDTKKCI